jgi:thioredoxin-like negative regulator of GroEL
MASANDYISVNASVPRWIGTAFFRCLALAVSGILPLSSTPVSAKESEPIRYFQFKFKPDQPAESLQNYLTFVQKNAPGIEGLRTQYAVADAYMAQGKWDEAAEILQTIVQVPQADEFFRASVLIKLADCNMRMAQFAAASGFYTAAAQSAVRSILPEATIGLALAWK